MGLPFRFQNNLTSTGGGKWCSVDFLKPRGLALSKKVESSCPHTSIYAFFWHALSLSGSWGCHSLTWLLFGEGRKRPGQVAPLLSLLSNCFKQITCDHIKKPKLNYLKRHRQSSSEAFCKKIHVWLFPFPFLKTYHIKELMENSSFWIIIFETLKWKPQKTNLFFVLLY